MQLGVVSSADNLTFFRDQNLGLLPIEQKIWQRIPNPVFNTNTDSQAWDFETTYYPVIARNLDRSVHLDSGGKMMMYYTGDNTDGEDLDQGGLALGDSVDSWSRFGTSPVLPLGGVGDPDRGDAQITSVFWDGTKFIVYYQGNATEPGDPGGNGDDVTICLATSTDGVTMSKQGRVVSKGSSGDGDFNDIYRPKLIPSGHDGLPKLYYTGQQTSSGPFGLMGASSASGSLEGPWTKITSSHLLEGPGPSFFLEDAWYEDDLYHFIYMTTGSSPGGLWYATSSDGLDVTTQRQLVRRRAGAWDSAVVRGSHYVIDGIDYIFFDASGSSGIGYVFATGE